MKIYSWNVNGIRAIEKKGFFPWLEKLSPDIMCLQEIKAQPEQLNETFHQFPGYYVYWMSAKRKGYSGTAVYTRTKPDQIDTLGLPEFDDEGRTQILHFHRFTLINAYFPNSQPEGARLSYKLEFCAAVLERMNALVKDGHNCIICGDFNIAHKPIDLARPKQNEGNPGYLPEERAWMSTFLDTGYRDTFREFTPGPDHYTWWSYRSRAREKNIGWRLDYFCVNGGFPLPIDASVILPDVMGSDHCPVMIDIKTD